MNLKDLANKMGVVDIFITHINNDFYKDYITIIIDDNILINLVGKTFETIPLSEKGINMHLQPSKVRQIINLVKSELKDVKI